MTKVKPTTKEQLVYYLLHNISLGTYDKRFLNNLQISLSMDKTPATSNQAGLLDKIVLRYAKQFRKQEIDANDMVKLPWGIEPIESLPEYTHAFCSIKDNIIEVRSPYKKDFITDVKNTKIHLTWNKETRIWSGPFCEETLKHFINCLDDHYQAVHYCPEVVKIINRMADYESLRYWNPTYVKVNGNYMIAGINETLNEVLSELPLDVDPCTLSRLTSAGVEISEDIRKDAISELWDTDEAHKLIEFVTTHNPIIGSDDLLSLSNYLVEVKCDLVVILESYHTASKQIPGLIESFERKSIKCIRVPRNNNIIVNFSEYEYPVVINMALWGVNQTGTKSGASKTVFLGNNKPIEIK